MRSHTPESLLMAMEAMNPGTPLTHVSEPNGKHRITIEDWKERVAQAGLWHTDFMNVQWTGFSVAFYFSDSSSITIKL